MLLPIVYVTHNRLLIGTASQYHCLGNDIGSQYRSAIYCESHKQLEAASKSLELFNEVLTAKGFPKITTEIAMNQPSFVAEEYHQQYLAKNPNGYCGIKGTGCVLPPL